MKIYHLHVDKIFGSSVMVSFNNTHYSFSFTSAKNIKLLNYGFSNNDELEQIHQYVESFLKDLYRGGHFEG